MRNLISEVRELVLKRETSNMRLALGSFTAFLFSIPECVGRAHAGGWLGRLGPKLLVHVIEKQQPQTRSIFRTSEM
jgi:hypothetical protein